MIISKNKLKVAMAIAGIDSITELERKTGISRISLTKYCSVKGIENITLKKLLKICTVLNCNIGDIIEFEKE